jgi:hypothetical protein
MVMFDDNELADEVSSGSWCESATSKCNAFVHTGTYSMPNCYFNKRYILAQCGTCLTMSLLDVE